MNHNCVVVAGGSRARFFTLEEAKHPEIQSGPNLLEINDLVNPERDVHDSELWSETKPGRNRNTAGGPAHGYDDHRNQHADEFERRFARDVAQEAARMTNNQNSKNLVLVAQKRMLGFLRDAMAPLAKSGIKIHELAKDLSKLPPQQVHEHLAKEALLPKRLPPGSI